MARISMAQLVMALVLAAAALLQGTAAEDYTVGGSTNWTARLPNTTFYENWASSIKFEVDDDLVFNFANGSHDVAQVTKEAYDACTTTNPIYRNATGPVVKVELNTTGAHYYICTFPGHCLAGQKLSINVVAEDTPPSPPPPPAGTPNTTSPPPPAGTPNTTTSPPPPPPPTPSSASSRGVAFAFVFMSLAVAFFC